jgi:hypothetical protein
MEDERAERHIHRAGPDRRREAVRGDDAHLGRVLRGVGGVTPDRRVHLESGDPDAPATAPRPCRQGQRDVRRSGADVEDPERLARPQAGQERRDVTPDGLRAADAVEARDVRERLGQLGGGRIELVHQLAARGLAG